MEMKLELVPIPVAALLSAAWNRFFSCNTGFAG